MLCDLSGPKSPNGIVGSREGIFSYWLNILFSYGNALTK